MRRRDVIEIGLYLLLAFGGEALVVMIRPPSGGYVAPSGTSATAPYVLTGAVRNVVFDLLPYAVFFLGLGLAFRVARREHLRVVPRGTEIGMYCATCGYDLRASPERCPECGGVGTATRMMPLSAANQWTVTIGYFFGVSFVAVLAAAAIMVHVQVLNMPVSGH